jgi:uncharacterized protein YjlB
MQQPETIILVDDGIFPNSEFPVLLYRRAVSVPLLFPARAFKRLFQSNNWTNTWKNGIFTFHHYHSNTHEVLGVYKGRTKLQLGGDNGVEITVSKGDVIVIPAGVAHRNLGKETQVMCVGAYPEGRSYDMHVGKTGERPQADQNIFLVPIPKTDPVQGRRGSLVRIWAGPA